MTEMRAAIAGTHVFVAVENVVPTFVTVHATWDGAVMHFMLEGYALHDAKPDNRGRWRFNHPSKATVFMRRDTLKA